MLCNDERAKANLWEQPKGAMESASSAFVQILFPFLFAGLGMVAAGLMFDRIIHWEVFQEVRELCIMVPALLGLKGNLEMTFASRLSSHAALGNLDSDARGSSLIAANLALVQCQSIVLGFLVAAVATAMSCIFDDGVSLDEFLLLSSSAALTASIASLLIGVVMVAVVIGARGCGCNPDNIAAPVAAALGDITTLALLAHSSKAIWEHRGSGLGAALVLSYVAVAALCAWRVLKSPEMMPVLYGGWSPIVASLCISSFGGLVLEHAAVRFPRIAAFQPVMNGAGGNLVAVQASRMATHLHSQSRAGDLHEDHDSHRGVLPWSVFSGPSRHAHTARVLMLLVVPGHLVFVWTLLATQKSQASSDSEELGVTFLAFYLLGALVQEWLLLYVCLHLVHLQWRRGVDPDNAAVPYLTAMGDLCGTVLLAGVFTATAQPAGATALALSKVCPWQQLPSRDTGILHSTAQGRSSGGALGRLATGGSSSSPLLVAGSIALLAMRKHLRSRRRSFRNAWQPLKGACEQPTPAMFG
mmetsp:Transcript_64096/g.149263  ORF Transcript_64096/g.149263 Transcript_64096/m.149263 type:complete len:528 (+) Transcript_64096:75-1658(+)